jgi:hypothetical protein
MRKILRRTTLPSGSAGRPAALLVGAALMVAPGGLVSEHAPLTPRPAVLARQVTTNTIVVTGKYSGTLKLDPEKGCTELLDEPKKHDIVELFYSGKLSGLTPNKWTFVAAEKGGGTFTQSHIPTTTAALLYPSNPATRANIGFTATAGTITIGGKAGSFSYKITWSNQPGSIGATTMGSGTATGSWSCPMVETI